MRSKSLRILLVAFAFSMTMFAGPGHHISYTQAVNSPQVEAAKANPNVDEPIIGLNFRIEGDPFVDESLTFIPSVVSGTKVSYRWDFGDGTTTGVIERPVHAFRLAGIYSITLFAVNDGDTKTVTRQLEIVRRPIPSPTITITGDRLVGSTVGFVADVNPNANVDVVWDFGDGEDPPRTGISVSHTFDYAGTFDVVVEVISRDDPTVRASATATVTIEDTPICCFTVPPYVQPGLVLQTGVTITFHVKVETGSDISYRWDFGDDSPVQVTREPVSSHKYSAPGNFKVIVTAFNDISSIHNALDDQLIITINDPVQPIQPITGLTVFCDEQELARLILCGAFVKTGGPATFFWEFGDGTSGVGDIVEHAYSADGKYPIYVRAISQLFPGGADSFATATTLVEVKAEPVRGFSPSLSMSPPPIEERRTYFTIAEIPDGAKSIRWNFGDGTDPMINTVAANTLFYAANHVYRTPGLYILTITAFGDGQTVLGVFDKVLVVKTALHLPVISQ